MVSVVYVGVKVDGARVRSGAWYVCELTRKAVHAGSPGLYTGTTPTQAGSVAFTTRHHGSRGVGRRKVLGGPH